VKFINPNIYSTYHHKAMGRVLYDVVIESNAKKIIDIGILFGYSTICLALAAKQTGGVVNSYDIFDEYKYFHTELDDVQENLKKYDVEDIVNIEKLSLNDWLDRKEYFDILHVDISNTGDIIEKVYQQYQDSVPHKCRIFFEGGSSNGDEQDWRVKYNMKKFSEIKNVPFKVLEEDNYHDRDKSRTFSVSISELGVK